MNDTFRDLRENDFSRLRAAGQIYLDHTGSALYPESLVEAHGRLLRTSVLGNPHSRNPSSRRSTEMVQSARDRVLAFFRADPSEYEVIFTPNASGALKLVGEAFPFGPGSRFCLTADNHNSVNGIREYAQGRGADVRYLRLDPDLRIADLATQLGGADPDLPNLFAYPAQSNFSGVQHPLGWIREAHDLGYVVLLDAAAYAPTCRLDLGEVKPDFACLSFYKMFGYPTGVGALLARCETLERLKRPWFCGGTVRFASAQNRVHISYHGAAAFEDGTLDFQGIAAVPAGLDFLDRIGVENISAHVTGLTARMLARLRALRHANGTPGARIYGPREGGRGGCVAFNLMHPDGRVFDCRRVEEAANEAGISIRTGYFCNPGAAEQSFELPEDEALRCYGELAGDEFTLQQFSACLHDKPVGAVRVSFGVSTLESDLDRLMAVLEKCRDEAAAAVSV